MKHLTFLYLFFLLGMPTTTDLIARSVHRRIDYTLPKISVHYPSETQTYSITSSHLELYPIFKITAQANYPYQLPQPGIHYDKKKPQFIATDTINALIENLLTEIDNDATIFTDFTILHKKDFNEKKKCGFIVFKFNNHPFVLKLSLETPETFVDPYSKGFIPKHFFFMAGGSNRHMSGLTRIKNLCILKEKVALLPQWADKVIFPNKWFWMPRNPVWLDITGENIGGVALVKTQLPARYGIIAEYVEKDASIQLTRKEKKKQTVSRKERKKQIINLCNDLDLMIDPHATNFVFKIDPITNKLTITVIDTEHFPTISGIQEKTKFNGHNRWYIYLAKKCVKDMYFRTKSERLAAQTRTSKHALF